jgi:hypothetical protein
MTPDAWKRLRCAVVASTLRPPERLVLLVAAHLRDLDPERLAEGAGVSVALVEASIGKLIEAGALERVGLDLRVVDAWTRIRPQVALLPQTGRQAEDRRIAAAWYARWASRHPRALKAIPDECERLALAAVDLLRREHGRDVAAIEREGADMLDWLAVGPDAAFWRREGHTSFQTAFRHTKLSDRLSRARAWADAGRPAADPAAEVPERKISAEDRDAAERSWAFVDRWIRAGESGIPAPAAEKMGPAKVSRLQAAIDAVGGWRAIGRLTRGDEADAKRAFVAAFVEWEPKAAGKGCAIRAQG